MDNGNECIPVQDLTYDCNKRTGKEQKMNRTVISVKEMGDLLGLKKTERYWLIHKKYFETKTAIGKTWVDIASFEDWYANQLKYKKVTGEEPGQKIWEWTFSVKDISEMLGIVEATAYDLIKREPIETVVIDNRIRVPKKTFYKWYAGQSHYRTQEDRQADAKIEESTLSFPQMAFLLGVTRDKVYSIIRGNKYSHYFEIVIVAGKQRVTKESFATFLAGQDQYRLCTGSDDRSSGEEIRINIPDEEGVYRERENRIPTASFCDNENLQSEQEIDSGDWQEEYISLEKAALRATMSRQAIAQYAKKGSFESFRIGRKVRISRTSFERWLSSRQEERMKR